MEKLRYMISDAANIVGVETHVLRYWEEELGMIIPRNEMGHRYYTEDHLRIFSQIKDMKERGYQLRAIRAILSGEEPSDAETSRSQVEGRGEGGCQVMEIPVKRDVRDAAGKDRQGNALSSAAEAVNAVKGVVQGQYMTSERTGHYEASERTGQGRYAVSERTGQGQYAASERTGQCADSEKTGQGQYMAADSNGAQEERDSMRENGGAVCSVGTLGQPGDCSEVEAGPDEKMNRFQAVMTHIVAQAMLCNNSCLAREIGQKVENHLLPELEILMKSAESRQEERFRKLDESMRMIQQNNRLRYEAAASKSPFLFGRRKKKKASRRI